MLDGACISSIGLGIVLWRWRSREVREARCGGLHPLIARQRIRPESFEVPFLRVVKEGAVQTQRAGFGAINEAGGIVRAHLVEYAHFEFAEGLAAEEAG